MYAAMMGVAFPLAPFWGALAERYSRRLVIVRSQYIETVAHLMLVVRAGRLVGAGRHGLLLGLTFGSIAVVIATQTLLTPRQHVGTAIASVQAAMPVAASIGPPAGRPADRSGRLARPLPDRRGPGIARRRCC